MDRPPTWLLLASLGVAGCNHYDFFTVADYATTSKKADIVFVIDNSSSMAEEAASLALSFDAFVSDLTDQGRALDYQLALTTSTVDYTANGATSAADPGEAGQLLGEPFNLLEDPAGAADRFAEALLCEATCWSTSSLEDDPSYVCGADPEGKVSRQYLDCLCGEDAWGDHCGSGTEEHLEAVLDTLCRAAPDAPALCWDEAVSPLSKADARSTRGLLREGAAPVVVVVTDEGDSSRRMAEGDEDPTDTYLTYFDAFGLPLHMAVIGPALDPNTSAFACNSGGATDYGTARLQAIAADTDGFYGYIEEPTGEQCAPVDFAAHLEDLSALLDMLSRVFPLASVPDLETIRVYVDGDEVPEARPVQDEAVLGYVDGWTYDASENAIMLWGVAMAEAVEIYYLPLDGQPRELPF